MRRVIILVLDSFGIGAAPDAARFGDEGANTLGAIAKDCRRRFELGTRNQPLHLPNLTDLGLMHAAQLATGEWPDQDHSDLATTGAWGCAAELSSGKDTPSGHWEIAGVPVLFDWGYFSDKAQTFPESLLADLIAQARLPGVLGNCHASGTEIIARLGDEHIKSGKPIVYTSADSVFQIAAHEEHFGLQRLYDTCEIARRLVDEYNVGRVIARPFVGHSAETYERTGNRRDLTTPPHAATLLDLLSAAGGEVVSVGKISDIFAHQGVTKQIKASGNAALLDATLQAMQDAPAPGLIFTNLVDFDMLFGHRRDIEGYAAALEYFDGRLPEITAAMRDDDLLIMCADHGCDPSWPGSDHTREFIPVLMYGRSIGGGSVGVRHSFADIGQTVAQYLELPATDYGEACHLQPLVAAG
ncbi:MAG: phosphopentomutase [Pseudomonadota bacterium]